MKTFTQSLIRQITRYLKLDAGYFLRGTFWGSTQQVVGILSGLFISYLFGHFVSRSLYGQYNLVISYISLLAFISLPGIDTALIRSVGRGFDASLQQGAKHKLRYSFIGSAVLLLISLYYTHIKETNLSLALLTTAFFFPLIYAYDLYADFLTAKKQFKIYAFIAIVSSFIFVALHTFTIFFQPTLVGLSLAYIAGLIIPSLIGYKVSQSYVENRKVDTEMYPYGRFLTLTNILPWSSGHIGNIILVHVLGPEALAVYAVANKLLVSIQKNFVVFHKPLSIKLAYQNPKQHRKTLSVHTFKLLGIGVLLSLGLWVVTPVYVNFFYTSNYHDAIRYGRWLSLALIPMPLTWVLADMIVYQKKRLAQLLSSSLMPIIKIGLYIFLVPKLGINALVFILLLERYTDPVLPILFLLQGTNKTVR